MRIRQSIESLLKSYIQRLYSLYNGRFFKSKGVKRGTGCSIYSDVSFGSEPYLITLGNNVRITQGVRFITHDGGLWTLRKMGLMEDMEYFGKITIGDNVHIGINSIIMPNVSIGNNCIIGCGAVVTHDIPANSIAVGIPARVIKSIDEYYESHKKICDHTKNYNKIEKELYLKQKYNID